MKRVNSQPVVELKRVSKVYQLDAEVVTALKSVSLEILEGEYISIKGPSGSGKSTLMHLMGLLDTPTEGQVVFEGRQVSGLGEAELAVIRNRKVGFVFQQFSLLERVAAWENVALPLVYAGVGATERRKRAVAELRAVGLGDRLDHRPNQLSGGQQQRVAIARALVNRPRIIFADEPTGNLDTESGKTVMKLLDMLNRKGKTIVLVTHELAVAAHAKRQIKIINGMIKT
ncbi:MAG: ABC transporter ATP-binding protein [Candidatus Chisholmbacteria bacterium]|nr:ABC transporter ATP-binding protein [Candidatus Chisholmbacteria bacterium]